MNERTVKLKISQVMSLMEGGSPRLAERIRELAARPTGAYELSLDDGGSWELAEGSPVPQGNSEREVLERSTGLPLTKLTDEEWDRVRDEATKIAADKLRLSYAQAASHYGEFIREGYEAAIKGRKGARGIPRTAEAAELSEIPDDYGDRMMRRTREYADKHGLTFNEAARHIV